MRKTLFSLLALIAMLLVVSCTDNLMDNPVEDVNVIEQSLVETEKQALILGENLLKSFPRVETRSGEQPKYPDYYGGAYINKDKRFVILVKGDTAVYKKDFVKRTQSSDILVVSCDYSYGKLNKVIEELKILYLDENNRATIDATTMRAFSLNTVENRINIKLEDLSADKISLFKQTVLDSPTFVFKKSNGVPVFEANLKPGGAVWNTPSTLTGLASIGYRAKQYGIPGIVVFSHFLPYSGTGLYHNGMQIGTCLSSTMSGSVDAAFCEVYSGSTIGQITQYGNKSLASSLGNLWSGGSVYMEGATTQRASSGSIQDVDDNGEFEFKIGSTGSTQRVYLTNVVRTNYASGPGDSGGVVYDSYNKPLGIHCAASVYGERYFIKGSEINRVLNLTMY